MLLQHKNTQKIYPPRPYHKKPLWPNPKKKLSVFKKKFGKENKPEQVKYIFEQYLTLNEIKENWIEVAGNNEKIQEQTPAIELLKIVLQKPKSFFSSNSKKICFSKLLLQIREHIPIYDFDLFDEKFYPHKPTILHRFCLLAKTLINTEDDEENLLNFLKTLIPFVDVKQKDSRGITPMMDCKVWSIIQELVKGGFNINDVDPQGRGMLYYNLDDIEIIKELYRCKEFDFHRKDQDGRGCFFWLVKRNEFLSNRTRVFQLFKNLNCNLNHVDNFGLNVLLYTVAWFDTEMTHLLVRSGVDISFAHEKSGFNALFLMLFRFWQQPDTLAIEKITQNHISCSQILVFLKDVIDLNQRDTYGRTVYHYTMILPKIFEDATKMKNSLNTLFQWNSMSPLFGSTTKDNLGKTLRDYENFKREMMFIESEWPGLKDYYENVF